MQLDIDTVTKAVPKRLRTFVDQPFVDKLNNIASDPFVAEQMKKNFIGYISVLENGKFSMDEYINAVMYVSYKLMGMTNADAYFKTFPQRHAQLVAKGTSTKDIACYVAAYNKGKLVNLIMEQTMVPTWVLNQDIYQKAINAQAELMMTARSEMVRCKAADSLLTHLKKPDAVQGPLINIDMRETSGLDELKKALVDLAQGQKQAIASGSVTPKLIAEQEIVNVGED